MALTSSFARRALVTGAAAAVALLALAVPASAHTGKPDAGCDKETGKTWLKVELTKYNADKVNTIKVTDGDKVVLPETKFGSTFSSTESQPDWAGKDSQFAGDVDHNFTVVVKAGDHVEGQDTFSFTWTKKVAACVEKEQPPAVTTTTMAPTTTTVAATTTTAAVVASTALANTGASIAIPLAIGALLLIGGVGMLILVRRRRRV